MLLFPAMILAVRTGKSSLVQLLDASWQSRFGQVGFDYIYDLANNKVNEQWCLSDDLHLSKQPGLIKYS